MRSLRAVVLSLALAGLGWSQSASLWIDVPFSRQTKDGCGSASLSMVMRYWDRQRTVSNDPAADPDAIQSTLYSAQAKGIYASSMQKYLRDAGYQVFAFAGEWSDLERHLAKGRPLIVALKASGAQGPLHYVVVVGIDTAQSFVFVNDPAQQRMLRLSRQGFESEWKGSRNWTLLAVPQA